jgi:hypothetical protein
MISAIANSIMVVQKGNIIEKILRIESIMTMRALFIRNLFYVAKPFTIVTTGRCGSVWNNAGTRTG